jgi:hypothetical protein
MDLLELKLASDELESWLPNQHDFQLDSAPHETLQSLS